ncbi:MAG: hypothetical protein GY868_06555 [Deltaproteobacteria bacterium]|nr:hypothetical protein [Deltaproteobacteria bacterium]
MIFVALVMFTLVCFFALIVNVGNRISTKIEMQNAADAAAISGGVWIARGLNLTSIMNVSMTNTLAMIILLEAFKDANNNLMSVIRSRIRYHRRKCLKALGFSSHCGKWALLAIKKPLVRIPWGISKPLINNFVPMGVKALWWAMKAIQWSEGALQLMGIMASMEAKVIAEQNGAAVPPLRTVLYPRKIKLPVKRGGFRDLCAPTSHTVRPDYNHHGYKHFIGNDWGALTLEMQGYFGKHGKIMDLLAGTWRKWFFISIDDTMGGAMERHYRSQVYSTYNRLPCAPASSPFGEGGGIHYCPDCPPKLKRNNSRIFGPPKPLMIDPDWLEEPCYLAVVKKPVKDNFFFRFKKFVGRGRFGKLLPQKTRAIAQVEVYNSTGADLFNQDWRARLVPYEPEKLKMKGARIDERFDNRANRPLRKALRELIAH